MRGEQVYLALTMSDGTVSIMGFGTANLRAPMPGETPDTTVTGPMGEQLPAVIERREVNEEEVRAECAKIVWESGAHMVSWRLLDGEPDLNDPYRNAWRDVRAARDISHDMPRARKLHRERIRDRRVKLFQKLTEEQERTNRRDDAKLDAIEAKRQRLRDAPADPRIDAAQTIEELKAVDPLAEAEEPSP